MKPSGLQLLYKETHKFPMFLNLQKQMQTFLRIPPTTPPKKNTRMLKSSYYRSCSKNSSFAWKRRLKHEHVLLL